MQEVNERVRGYSEECRSGIWRARIMLDNNSTP
jgi:hypothetical protein